MGYPYVGNNAPYYAPQQQPMFPQPDCIATIALEELEDWKNSLIHRIEKL